MPVIQTARGAVDVFNWGYQLQGDNFAVSHFASAAHDLLVIDYSLDGRLDEAFAAQEVADMADGPGGPKVMVSYISIGEVEDFRSHWDPAWTTTGQATGANTGVAPHWLGPTNPDWPESRKVRYWEAGWQEVIFNDSHTGWLDTIVAQGFDAAYLDIVDAYYFWAVEATPAERLPGDPAFGDEKDAAQRMIDFVVAMTAHARETNPDFFVILQNGDFIIDALAGVDPARKQALLDAIGGIGVEDVYFGGAADENNAFRPDEARIAALKRDFLGNGKFVLSIDYVNTPGKIGQFVAAAVEDGFMPFVAPDRDLDRLSPPLGAKVATVGSDVLFGTAAADTINALAGNDIFNGLAGNDVLTGAGGADHVFGDKGADRLKGGGGADILSGGRGNDVLIGGAGPDVFVFRRGDGSDTVRDFHDGIDRLDLTWLARSFAAVLAHADDVGANVQLHFGATHVLILGLDKADLSAGDVILI